MTRLGRVLFSVSSVVVVLAITVILLFVVPSREDKICSDIIIEVADFDTHRFLTESMLESHLKSEGRYPKGQMVSDISLAQIEKCLTDLPMVRDAVCFFDAGARLKIMVVQREPIFRVMFSGEDYYVDTEGNKLPTSRRFSVNVPVVTGAVNADFVQNELFGFMSYLHQSSRWATAFTQVCVYPDKELELIPRVGNFVVVLGGLDRYEQKLYKLDVFLNKVPKYKSWDYYSVINLKYKDQVVCTKR